MWGREVWSVKIEVVGKVPLEPEGGPWQREVEKTHLSSFQQLFSEPVGIFYAGFDNDTLMPCRNQDWFLWTA